MISKQLLIIILLSIFPGNLEYVLHIYNGNMGIYGMYLGIMQQRNMLYLSFLIFLLSCYFKYYIFGLFILFISLYLFINSIYKWKDIILLHL
jgi:hypothetical protein